MHRGKATTLTLRQLYPNVLYGNNKHSVVLVASPFVVACIHSYIVVSTYVGPSARYLYTYHPLVDCLYCLQSRLSD